MKQQAMCFEPCILLYVLNDYGIVLMIAIADFFSGVQVCDARNDYQRFGARPKKML